ATRARAGSMRKSWSTTDWFRVASPTTFQRLTKKRSKNSLEARTNPPWLPKIPSHFVGRLCQTPAPSIKRWRFTETPYNCFAAAARAMTTANKITVVRILMIPAFVTMAIYYGESIQRGQPLEWQRFAAIAIFILAAVSD